MCIASGLGLNVEPEAIDGDPFAEPVGEYLVEWNEALENSALARAAEIEPVRFGRVLAEPRFMDIPIADLQSAWRGTLDW